MDNYIYIKGQRYNYFDTYDTWNEAYKQAIRQKKRNKTKYFILKVERGFLFPEIKYRLYMNKVMRLFG